MVERRGTIAVEYLQSETLTRHCQALPGRRRKSERTEQLTTNQSHSGTGGERAFTESCQGASWELPTPPPASTIKIISMHIAHLSPLTTYMMLCTESGVYSSLPLLRFVHGWSFYSVSISHWMTVKVPLMHFYIVETQQSHEVTSSCLGCCSAAVLQEYLQYF